MLNRTNSPSPESRLPAELLARAAISPGGELGWRSVDVEGVIAAAAANNLACTGGQIQWQFPDGTCEAYWLNYDADEIGLGEPWDEYVRRSCSQVLERFRELSRRTDWRGEAMKWPFIREKMSGGADPEAFRWCMLYFDNQC